MVDSSTSLNNLTVGDLEQYLNVANPNDQFAYASDATTIWILISGFLVFFMHLGFAMLEAGAVRAKNTVNILYKNLMTVCIGVIGYFLLGYGFAYGGNSSAEAFIGNGNYAMTDLPADQYYFWFFQMVFAATCATIVSGAVAERTKLEMYFIVTLYLVCFVYPVVSHWIWGEGWLSAFRTNDPILFSSQAAKAGYTATGMIDYAGSTVVHLTGGVSGLVGAIAVGPRVGRFEQLADGKLGKVLPMPGHNLTLSALGTFILWFGWYGFNCGSTLAFDGLNAQHVAVTTSISPAMATITGSLFHYLKNGHFDLGVALNCALAGLVSITAGCSVIKPWVSMFVGMIGAFVYIGCSNLVKMMKVDDPLDAVAVHGGCGIWGTLAAGIFVDTNLVEQAYGVANSRAGWIFLTQLVGVISIILWVGANAIFIFYLLKMTFGLRVSEQFEVEGLDSSEHGAVAYELNAVNQTAEEYEEEKKFVQDKKDAVKEGLAFGDENPTKEKEGTTEGAEASLSQV